jgi:MFS family permease
MTSETIGEVSAEASADRSLRRNADFVNLWIAETISQAGSQVSLVALPLLAIYVLDAAPSQMGFLAAAGTAPFLFIGLFVGVWVDRVRRRPLMIAADVMRGLLLLLVPLAWMLDMLRIEMLYAVALLTGCLTVVFDVAWQAYVPTVVRRRNLVAANSKLQVSASVAQVTGPGVGGALVGLIGAPLTILVDAASYLVSGAFLTRIRAEEQSVECAKPRQNVWKEVVAGLRLTYASALLRALIYSRVVVTFSSGVFFAVYVLFMADNLGLGATAVGLVFALGGLGSLLGAAVAERLSHRFGEGRTVIGAQFAFGAFGITLPLAVFVPAIALPMVLVSEFAQWMAHIISQVNDHSIRQSTVEDRYLGRVSSVFQFFGRGLMPLGALTGGVLGELIGVPLTLVVASGGFLVAFLFVLFSPLRSFDLAAAEEERAFATAV